MSLRKTLRTSRLASVAPMLLLTLVPIQSRASHTPNPSTVAVVGDLQEELDCPGDWQPDCATTHLTYDAEDLVWQQVFTVPAGSWEYKATLNDSWDENYGDGGVPGGDNIPFTVSECYSEVSFTYDPITHILTIACDEPPEPENNPPVAECMDVTVSTSPQGDCSAPADIDNGSYDPDGDVLTFDRNPEGPYGLGDTEVTLTVTDPDGESDSCTGTVTVEDQEAPFIECNSPATIAPPDAPASFTATASDNCGVSDVSIPGYDCFWYNPAGKRVDKTGACVISVAGDTLTVHQTGGVKTNVEWDVTATDSSGNSIAMTCGLQVVKPSH